MTDADPRSDDHLPPPWLIVTGIVAALSLIFLLGFGVGGQWGAPQWGPLAEWLAGAATFAAVVVALQQSAQARREARRGHLARLVDHEVSRRRECMKALGELWAALVGVGMDFRSFVNYLDDLPREFNPVGQRHTGPLRELQTYGDEVIEQIQQFFAKWMDTIEPALFVALYLLHDTPMYPAVGQINDGINEIRKDGIPSITRPIIQGRRPDTAQLTTMWNNILRRRDEHLKLARQHFSLTHKDVERYVRQRFQA